MTMRRQRRFVQTYPHHQHEDSTCGISSLNYEELMNAESEQDSSHPSPASSYEGGVGGSERKTTGLTWRGEPSVTFADWTVMVITNEGDSYSHHVHRSTLCYGSRSSGFFKRVMAKTAEVLPSTKVELDQRDAKNFPLMLDFMYASPQQNELSSSGTVATANSTMSTSTSTTEVMSSNKAICDRGRGIINRENAVSLRHLARVFEVDSLMLSVNKFIQSDLNFETTLNYLILANEYQDTVLFQSVIRLCQENLEVLDKSAIAKLPFHIFRMLVRSFESFKDDDKETSLFLSEVVCRFLEMNRTVVTSAVLIDLTDTLFMPYIAPEAAIGFTAVVKSLRPEDAKANWDQLVELCRRCAQTVVQEYGWNDFSVDGALDEYLRHSISVRSEMNCVDSLLFASSFAAALAQAQSDYDKVDSTQTELESMVGSLNKTIDVLEKANDRKNRYMASQDAALVESRKRVTGLENEVRELKEQLQKQKQLTAQAQLSSSADARRMNINTGGLRSNGAPPRSPMAPPRRPANPGNRPSPSLRSSSTTRASARRTETGITTSRSEDPAIRDLVSPSSMQTEVRGRTASRFVHADSLDQMRSKSIA